MSPDVDVSNRPTTLFDYRRIELNVVSDLQRLRAISERIGLEPETIELIDTALARNKEQKFSIAVVGEFKRGKSTFINALLGKEILPADVLPCSATLNRVTYGFEPRVELHFKENGDSGRVEQIAIDQLVDYVTKLTPEAEERAAAIEQAIVHYPLPYLKNNVDIIDTPGLNDDQTMTEVTLSVLPETSAAILVIMATAPFSQYEADFLNNQLLLNDLGRIIFVVTGIDLIRREQDRDRVLQGIRKRIEDSVERRLLDQFGSKESEDFRFYRTQIGKPNVFGLSGYDALIGKEEGDDELLEASGFARFERALDRFLTETRGAVELQTLANRIIAASNQILKKLNIEVGALEMAQEEFDEKYENAMADLDDLLQRRDQEIAAIESAARKTRERLRPIVDGLGDEMKEAAFQAIDDTEVSLNELKEESAQEKLNDEISRAIKAATRPINERVQIELERDVRAEVERLADFKDRVTEVLHRVEMDFSHVDAGVAVSDERVATAVLGSFYPLVGGAVGGYQHGGAKGAVVGGAAGSAAFLSGYVLVGAALGAAFLTLPVVLGLGVASTLVGGKVAERVFGDRKIERFKEKYKRQIATSIDTQLKIKRLDLEVDTHVNDLYGALKERLIGELDTAMNQTRSTLEDLRQQKARQETLAEHRQKEVEAMRDEVQAIRNRAQGLAAQLIEIDSV